MQKIASEILLLYKQVNMLTGRWYRQQCGKVKVNITMPQAMVLDALGKNGPMKISELAEFTHSTNSTASGIVDRLENLNLVKRVRSEEDRRIVMVHLTDTLPSMQKDAEVALDQYFAKILSPASPAEVDQIIGGLRKLRDLLQHAPGTEEAAG
ncbi:MAG: MarR family winged helix-turn-helix transcriptional regulator [Christensenellales bacterium]|jgi:DNA-binding MarR family transcriptional regulator